MGLITFGSNKNEWKKKEERKEDRFSPQAFFFFSLLPFLVHVHSRHQKNKAWERGYKFPTLVHHIYTITTHSMYTVVCTYPILYKHKTLVPKLTGMGILERSFPIQFFMMDQRLSLWLGLGGTDVRLLSKVGLMLTKKLDEGPAGS